MREAAVTLRHGALEVELWRDPAYTSGSANDHVAALALPSLEAWWTTRTR